MNSAYQVQSTHYANLALASGHAIVDDLCRRADRLAPRFSAETLEAGATNARPGEDQPRRRQVWDMHAEALSWNLIADRTDVVVEAKVLESRGTDYFAAWSCDETDRVVLITGPTPSYHESIEIARQAPAGRIVVAPRTPSVNTVDPDAVAARVQANVATMNLVPRVAPLFAQANAERIAYVEYLPDLAQGTGSRLCGEPAALVEAVGHQVFIAQSPNAAADSLGVCTCGTGFGYNTHATVYFAALRHLHQHAPVSL